MTEQPKKILVIRFSSIGDIVLTSPLVRCLKRQLPQVELHFLTKKQNAGILTANPYIDQLHLFEGDLKATIRVLKSEQFDFVVDLHSNIRSGIVRKSLAVRSQVFKKMNLEKWLFTTFKMNRLKGQHIVDRYLKTVEELGVVNDGEGLDFFIANDQQVDLQKELPKLSKLPELSLSSVTLSEKRPVDLEPFVAYGIGALHATKRLPTNKIVELLRQIQRPVLLLGGPNDSARAEDILEALQSSKSHEDVVIHKVVNVCGKYTLQQSSSILQQAEWVICHDSALMHISAALNKKIALLWGNTHPDFGMYPYPKNSDSIAHNFEVDGLSCRPCSKIGYESCPKKHFKCMNEQNLNEIAQLVNH